MIFFFFLVGAKADDVCVCCAGLDATFSFVFDAEFGPVLGHGVELDE
jgi:hypothetical protein